MLLCKLPLLWFIVVIIHLSLSQPEEIEIRPGRTNVGPKTQSNNSNSDTSPYTPPSNPAGFAKYNNGKILTANAHLPSWRGHSETSIAQTRCGNLIFVGFNNIQGVCNDNHPDHPSCPGVPEGFSNGISGYTVSFNGGKTWKYMYGPPPLGTNYYSGGDPWFSIGGKSGKDIPEMLYFSSLARDGCSSCENIGLVVHVARIIYKNNDPRNIAIDFEWIRASLIPKINDDDFLDKEAIAADPYNPYNAYVSLTLFNSQIRFDIQAYATHNAGVSWEGPVVLKEGYEQTRIWNQMTYPLVNADGEVYVLWFGFTNTELYLESLRYMFVRSTDGGMTYTEPIPINPTFVRYNPICQLPIAHNKPFLSWQPTMDVFTNKKNKKYLNRIIASYMFAYEGACDSSTFGGFINDTASILNSVDIGISYSDDMGETWNFVYPFRKNIADRFVKRIFPTISVSSNGETVNIAYFQINETKRVDLPICKALLFELRTSFYHTFVDTYYIRSNNGGITWSDPIKLNDEAVDWCESISNSRPNFGDYQLSVTDQYGILHYAAVTTGFTEWAILPPPNPRYTVDVIYYTSEKCNIKNRCEQTEDCCTGNDMTDVTCSSNVKWSKKKGDKFCCVNNMGECKNDYECCGGKTRCINYVCHNSGQWRGIYDALSNNNQHLIEDIIEGNSNIDVDVDISWKIIVIGVCIILLCISWPCLLWITDVQSKK